MNVEACCLPHPREPNAFLLYLELSAAEEVLKPRKPVHLALAIDASSSMGGARMACAVDAARAVVDRLGPEDTLLLLSFDRTVRVLFGPSKVDDAARKQMHQALNELRPGMGTNLFTALDKSYEGLRRVFVRDARPHCIILTDGFPSVGVSDKESYRALARKAHADGITTSAVGVGVDYDQECVAAISEGGGGRYSFVDKAADIPGALARHLTDLFAIAVEGVTVRVSPAQSVKEAQLLHRYAMRVVSDGFSVETGPIGRGTPRRLLFHMKAAQKPEPVAATVAITARGLGDAPDRILPVPVNPTAPSAPEAKRELYRLLLSQKEESFWDAMHAGRRPVAEAALKEARGLLDELVVAGAEQGEIEGDRARLDDAKLVLDGRLSQEAQEAARKRSHHTAISRVTSLSFDDES